MRFVSAKKPPRISAACRKAMAKLEAIKGSPRAEDAGSQLARSKLSSIFHALAFANTQVVVLDECSSVGWQPWLTLEISPHSSSALALRRPMQGFSRRLP